MPIDTRRESRVVAVIDADVTGVAGPSPDLPTLRAALDSVNRTLRPALWEPFSAATPDRFDGAPADPSQAPLCLSLLRESLAPHLVRAGVGVGVVELGAENGDGRDAHALARRALQLVIREGGLTRYLGTGEAGDVLLGALCRLVDPILRARSGKQWEAVAAYRELGHQQAAARRLGVTRQSVGERLAAGRWRDVDEADAAVSVYLGLTAARPPGA
jgi:hypothetical protein